MDPAIRARNGVPQPSEAQASSWVTGSAARAAAGEAWEWAIIDATSGELAGRRALKEIEWDRGLALAACWVAPRFRGRRFASRSLRLAAAHAFAHGIVRVRAECEADNEASIRSVLAAGMRHERTLRSHFISNAGVPADAQLFGLVAEDLARVPASPALPLRGS